MRNFIIIFVSASCEYFFRQRLTIWHGTSRCKGNAPDMRNRFEVAPAFLVSSFWRRSACLGMRNSFSNPDVHLWLLQGIQNIAFEQSRQTRREIRNIDSLHAETNTGAIQHDALVKMLPRSPSAGKSRRQTPSPQKEHHTTEHSKSTGMAQQASDQHLRASPTMRSNHNTRA